MSDKLKVIVHYAAAKNPYQDEYAHRSETVGMLKTRVLKAFDLTEGESADGKTFTYTLYHGKMPLENPNETLGAIVDHEQKHEKRHEHHNEHEEHHDVLELKLSQQVTQG